MEVAASCVTSMGSTGGVHGQLARTIQCGHPMPTKSNRSSSLDRLTSLPSSWPLYAVREEVYEISRRVYPSRTNGHTLVPIQVAVVSRPSLHVSVSSFVCLVPSPSPPPIGPPSISALNDGWIED